ncbi:MAG TPA: hypothetical protein VHZ95_15190 [Polyangiales bacterium]|nr:hypothetical protein [Polyangiales bacterium]
MPQRLTCEAVRALAREPLHCTLGAIRAACDRLRYADAIARIFARAVLSVPTPADELLPLLAGLGTPYLIRALFAVATGDRAAVAIRSVNVRGIPTDTSDANARALALFLAWQYRKSDDIRDVLVRLARTVARAPVGAEGGGVMHALAAEVGDPDLLAVVTASGLGPHHAATRPFDASIETIVRDLDARAVETHVMPLWPPDLAELAAAPPPTTPEALLDATRRFAEARLWDQASSFAEAAVSLGQACADRYYALLAEQAAIAGQFGIAATRLRQIRDESRVPRAVQLGVLLAQPEDAALREAIGSLYQGVIDEPRQAEQVAHALLASVRPLGLLVARGCVASADDRADGLLHAIEHARDALGLPPFDRAWQQHKHARELADFRNAVAAQLTSLTGERDTARERLAAAERVAFTERGEAERTRTELRVEREHVEMLEAIIRERNEERAELRRDRDELRHQLNSLDVIAAATSTLDAGDPDSDDEGEAATAAVRRALGCETSRDVREALREVPPHVAAEAMRTLGQLAAGDAAAWRGVKQAKGTAAPIYQARIGIHHRLIFRTDEHTLHAIHLVTRASLLGALRRVRGAR